MAVLYCSFLGYIRINWGVRRYLQAHPPTPSCLVTKTLGQLGLLAPIFEKATLESGRFSRTMSGIDFGG